MSPASHTQPQPNLAHMPLQVDITDEYNYGRCNVKCSGANAIMECKNQVCGIESCVGPYDDCDRNAVNGCEKNTDTDLDNCGRCFNRCVLPQATSACVDRKCKVQSCNTGFDNCDGNDNNGCEVGA